MAYPAYPGVPQPGGPHHHHHPPPPHAGQPAVHQPARQVRSDNVYGIAVSKWVLEFHLQHQQYYSKRPMSTIIDRRYNVVKNGIK